MAKLIGILTSGGTLSKQLGLKSGYRYHHNIIQAETHHRSAFRFKNADNSEAVAFYFYPLPDQVIRTEEVLSHLTPQYDNHIS